MTQPLVPCLSIDRSDAAPLYVQVYRGIREAILKGQLVAGQRLPSTRSLARELGISRLPVLTAFEQLVHEGYLAGRVGAGTYVSATAGDRGWAPRDRERGSTARVRQPAAASENGHEETADPTCC